MEITTTITCHGCGNKLELEWQSLPSMSDVASNLGRLGWIKESNDGRTFDLCPDCSKKQGQVLTA